MATPASNVFFTRLVDICTTRIDSLTADQKNVGVEGVLKIIKEQPENFVSKVLLGDEYMPSTFILYNIVDLLKDADRLSEFVSIFTKDCAGEMVTACVYNIHDLKRILEFFPHHAVKIMELSIEAKRAHGPKYFSDIGDQQILDACIDNLNITPEIKAELSQYVTDFLAPTASEAPRPN